MTDRDLFGAIMPDEAAEELPADAPPPPTDVELDPAMPKTQLQLRVQEVLLGLPAFMTFTNQVSGVNATDLFSLNTLLGASIEGQVVKALNQQRKLWDPDDEWVGYAFERQSQAFPDVRLVRKGGEEPDIALGIELKGWFLLSKEMEPSYRFRQTPAACADHDLLCVVPWYLDNVLSGAPVAAEPLVTSARWAAQMRNYYWEHGRKARAGSNRTIVMPEHATTYPGKADAVLDRAVDDSGSNFGRVARSGLGREFVQHSNDLEVLGIRIRDWCAFLKVHSDQADPDAVSEKLADELAKQWGRRSQQRAVRVAEVVRELVREYGD